MKLLYLVATVREERVGVEGSWQIETRHDFITLDD